MPAVQTTNKPTPHLKRAFDLLFASLAIVLTAPLFLVIAIAIKLDSPGPVFYRQLRVGRQCPDRTLLFEIIKFRSMVNDAEGTSGPVWATQNDNRVTPVGAILRKTRLDELPQFINVFRGDMSLVGPRPERPVFYRTLENNIPFFVERINGVTPGITGLAQINQGYDSCLDDVRRKLCFDLQYSLALVSPYRWIATDLYVVFKTILIMVLRQGR